MADDPKTPTSSPAAARTPDPEVIARLRERTAALEEGQKSHALRLERGAGTMDETRRAMADLSRTLEADRAECAKTFGKIRDELKPPPWTPKRVMAWLAGSSLLVSLVCAVGLAALQLRDEVRGAADKARAAVIEASKLSEQVGAVQTQGGGLAVEVQAIKATVQGEAERSRDLDRKLEKFLDARLRGN